MGYERGRRQGSNRGQVTFRNEVTNVQSPSKATSQGGAGCPRCACPLSLSFVSTSTKFSTNSKKHFINQLFSLIIMGAKKTHQNSKLSYVYVSNAGSVPAVTTLRDDFQTITNSLELCTCTPYCLSPGQDHPVLILQWITAVSNVTGASTPILCASSLQTLRQLL